MEPPAGSSDPTGPFAAATARLSALGGYTAADYYENGKGMLGITRGQIGAFYERELEYNIQLTHTEEDGLPIVNQAGDLSKPTTIDEAGFAVLDSGVARFPFIGAEEDKPAGVATSGASTQAGDNTVSVRSSRYRVCTVRYCCRWNFPRSFSWLKYYCQLFRWNCRRLWT